MLEEARDSELMRLLASLLALKGRVLMDVTGYDLHIRS